MGVRFSLCLRRAHILMAPILWDGAFLTRSLQGCGSYEIPCLC